LKDQFDEKLGQIAHLDKHPSHSEEDNLVYLCFDHHTIYDSTTRQHKNYTITEVKRYRRRLYEEVLRRQGRFVPSEDDAFHEELAEIGREMIAASTSFDLRGLLFRTKTLAAQYSNHPEVYKAHQLLDQLERSLVRASASIERSVPYSGDRQVKHRKSFVAIGLFAILLLILMLFVRECSPSNLRGTSQIYIRSGEVVSVRWMIHYVDPHEAHRIRVPELNVDRSQVIITATTDWAGALETLAPHLVELSGHLLGAEQLRFPNALVCIKQTGRNDKEPVCVSFKDYFIDATFLLKRNHGLKWPQ
jgi:hypothetical protein